MKRPRYELRNGKYQPVLLEEHVLREIVDRLWFQARIKLWQIRERIPGRGRLSTAGIPDLIGWIPKGTNTSACPLFVEVKRPGGVHRMSQELFIQEAKRDGCIAFFAHSWQDVVDNLKPFGIELAA